MQKRSECRLSSGDRKHPATLGPVEAQGDESYHLVLVACRHRGAVFCRWRKQRTMQTQQKSPPQIGAPAKDAHVISFHVETEGALHIIYSDGAEVEVSKERGRFGVGEHTLTQETFSDIQLADDRQNIGWLAE